METVDKGNPAEWDVVVDTNIKGLLHMTRAILPGWWKKPWSYN